MPGRRPPEAVAKFLAPLQLAASCITKAVFEVGGGYHPADTPHVLILNRGEPVRLRGSGGELALSVLMQYRIVRADAERGPWKVRTMAYAYTLFEAGRESLAYHWHPERREEGQWVTFPHLHVSAGGAVGRRLEKAHLPTGRVALEDVVRLALTDLKVTALRPDWERVLRATQAAYEKWRTWS